MANPRTIARLEAAIQRRVAHCLQHELADPRAEFITVVRVELNADLSVAKIFYSVLGDSADRSKVTHMFDSAAGFIRKQVGGVLRTKSTPELRFVPDETMSEADRMDDIISAALRKDREIRDGDEDDEPAGADSPQG
ncbi:MAG: 30S ribosome-binding factor RbfA [Planctomycetota bacterium]